MTFASIGFILLLFPIYFILDRLLMLLRRGAVWRNGLLLAVSMLFYCWGEARNILLLLGLGLLDFWGAKFLQNRRSAHAVLVVLLLVNLSVLFWYKYAVWVVNSLFDLGNACWSGLLPNMWDKHISLPLGISFFTFHSISYILDVYRNKTKASRSVWDFLTYFCMFPHLVAGPIVRYAQVEPDLRLRDSKSTAELFSFGVYRFLQGLNKKVLIANSAASVADIAFTLSVNGALTFGDAWVGIVAYTIQIYFDFSGYSDMAIGLAAIAGFHFEENFVRPYSSSSMRDFWRRWHISLSSWLRDYVYIPLGGSRCSVGRVCCNLLVIFLLCGIWHGAGITFLLWGLWHGAFLVIERVWNARFPNWQVPRFFARFYTLLIVMLGWVLFRAESIQSAGSYISSLFLFQWAPLALTEFGVSLVVVAAAVVLCLLPDRWIPAPTSATPRSFPFGLYAIQALLSVLSLAILVQGSRNPFIYFNF